MGYDFKYRTIVDAFLVCVAVYVIGQLLRKRNLKAPLPPGPRGWPFVGNLFDIPTEGAYFTFAEMGKKYGDIISLSVLGTPYIILNSTTSATAILSQKSLITSNRPHFTLAHDLVGWGETMIFLQYGEKYRQHRRFFQRQIGMKSGLRVFWGVEVEEGKKFLRDVVRSPDDLVAHSRRMATSVILKISHGYDVKGDDDPLVEMADTAMEMFSVVVTPGRFLVDTIPALRYLPEWFPGARFKKDAKRWREMIMQTAAVPHQLVLEQIAKGEAAPSFTSRLLEEGVSPEEEAMLKWAAFSMYLGGSDTTPSALSAFFLAMVKFPDVFKKAQAEVDTVVGSERLPTFEDRESLPYVNALCLELLRWNCVIPLAMHVATEDDVYNGYLIPKGSVILGNVWYMLSNPDIYPHPEIFNPDRFLGPSPQPDPRSTCFGFGRRSCPGSHLAEMTIFCVVAMALATVDVGRGMVGGVEVEPRLEVKEGIVRHVEAFKCRVVVRSKKAEELLQG